MKELIKKIIPSFLIDFYHRLLPALGAFFYAFPSLKLTVIGVTGTCGKSTVVAMIHQILEGAGFKVASVSSIRFKINEKEWPNTLKMTMPGRMKLQRFLREAVNSGCQYAVLEVTSEGILQHRHSFIDFDVAVFTNLTPEHIERHGGFENYKKAKGKLFQALKMQRSKCKNQNENLRCKKISIINLDDKNADYFLQFPSDQKICYGINFNLEDARKLKIENCKFIKASNIQMSSQEIQFRVENTLFHLNLPGTFNVYNALAGICVGLSQGISLAVCKNSLEKIKKMPGRLETVIEKPFRVVVDYAHTPDALEKVYRTLLNIREISGYIQGNSRLICVLGSCGGGRDKWKRPVLGKIASQYCSQIILTNEDPYDENPQHIIDQIESGFSQILNSKSEIRNKSQIPKYEKILDRRKAIRKALELAGEGDIVIITGKGSEPWMCIKGGKKISWDDREVVREQLRKLKIQN